MTDTPKRCSSLHQWLVQQGAEFNNDFEMPIAMRLRSEEIEKDAVQSLGLCDVTALAKMGLKGSESQSWLAARDIDVPAETYAAAPISDGGIVVRLGADEFLLQSGIENTTVVRLSKELDRRQPNVYRVEREEATILLVGSQALEVLAQTCGIDFQTATTDRLVLTRVAGVNCGVLPDTSIGPIVFRIWVDSSLAVYLWETLVTISDELGGSVVGAGCLFPQSG